MTPGMRVWRKVSRTSGYIRIVFATSVTDPRKPFSIRSLTSITHRSPRSWQNRAGNCRVMCDASSKISCNAAGWSTVFCGCAASLATPSIWLRLAANEEGSARAAVPGAWPKAQPCWLMKYYQNNPCVSGY